MLARDDTGQRVSLDFGMNVPHWITFLPINFRRKSLILLVNFQDKMNAFKKMKRFILTVFNSRAFNLSA
ncbi:hypothetical protein CHH27_01575 [Labrenzia sp. VG12]|nr:hypothetical protein CHH27_01575 [Labrenzia sp. VG12]